VEERFWRVHLDVLRGRDISYAVPEINMLFHSTVLRPEVINPLREVMFLWYGGPGKLLKGRTVLEVACGPGYETEHLLRLAGGDCRIIAMDFFPEVLGLAKLHVIEWEGRKVKLEDLPQVEFVLADPEFREPWPVEDGTADTATLIGVLHWTWRIKEMFGEAYRVLKPGGVLVGLEFGKKGRGPPWWTPCFPSWGPARSGPQRRSGRPWRRRASGKYGWSSTEPSSRRIKHKRHRSFTRLSLKAYLKGAAPGMVRPHSASTRPCRKLPEDF